MNLFVLSERLAAEKTINTKRIAMIPNSAKIIIFNYINSDCLNSQEQWFLTISYRLA